MEAAARLSGSRFAYLKGDLVLLELALVQLRDRHRPRARATSRWCRRCWSAKRRWRGPATSPRRASRSTRSRRTTLFLTGTSEVRARRACTPTRSSTPPTCRCATAPSRPASAARRAPRQRHARHVPRPPVRQGRDVLVRRPGRVEGRARAAAGDRGADPRRAGASPTGWSTSRSATSARRRRRSTTARRGSRRRAATASSPPARTRPTTRRDASVVDIGLATANPRRQCTR